MTRKHNRSRENSKTNLIKYSCTPSNIPFFNLLWKKWNTNFSWTIIYIHWLFFFFFFVLNHRVRCAPEFIHMLNSQNSWQHQDVFRNSNASLPVCSSIFAFVRKQHVPIANSPGRFPLINCTTWFRPLGNPISTMARFLQMVGKVLRCIHLLL
jgi:hypothetical protein